MVSVDAANVLQNGNRNSFGCMCGAQLIAIFLVRAFNLSVKQMLSNATKAATPRRKRKKLRP